MTSRVGYVDCVSGVAGDMLLGAFIDAGWPLERLSAVVDALGLRDEVAVSATPVMRGAVRAVKVNVTPHSGEQPHRHLHDIEHILEASTLAPGVRSRAAAVFRRLAEAEAAVHGTTIEQVHFHEVGALDAVIDIVGTVQALDDLEVDDLYSSSVPLGGGAVQSAHGPIPVPAPATLSLLAAVSAPVATNPPGTQGELATPTGAALLAELATFSRPAMRVERVGSGAGTRDTAWPNVIRIWLGYPEPDARDPETGAMGSVVSPDSFDVAAGLDSGLRTDAVAVLEANIDDMQPELYAPAVEALFEAGALDVTLVPAYMKKGRPAVVLSVVCPAVLEHDIARLMLVHTSTFGVRVNPMRRYVAEREIAVVQTPYGEIRVKWKAVGGERISVSPEFEDCRRAAAKSGVPVDRVYRAALTAVEPREEEPYGSGP